LRLFVYILVSGYSNDILHSLMLLYETIKNECTIKYMFY